MPSKKIIAIIQARMGSSRLPGKVMQEICGQPMLAWVVNRARLAKSVEQVIVATSTDLLDSDIVLFCQKNAIDFFMGSPTDVLDRFYQTALKFKADYIVRLTADCPFIDPDLIDEVVKVLLESDFDFVANRLPPPYKRTYPIGLDVEAVAFPALQRAWKNATQLYEREHVMPFLYEVPGRFRIKILDYIKDLGTMRWTVDTAQDLDFIRQVANQLNCRNDFSWKEVLKVIELLPELSKINAGVDHKTFKDVDERTDGVKRK